MALDTEQTKEELIFGKDLVEHILINDEESRNSDKRLIWKILQYYGLRLDYNEFKKINSFESFTRMRRKLQHERNELLPTDPEVIEK
ncbi:MAG: hypothetical protein ACOC3Z_00540, partial [Nanoarchaeota archaeon]